MWTSTLAPEDGQLLLATRSDSSRPQVDDNDIGTPYQHVRPQSPAGTPAHFACVTVPCRVHEGYEVVNDVETARSETTTLSAPGV